jgi:3-oxoadipate enol-lactonase
MEKQPSEKFIRVNDVDICYTDSEREDTPIIFIHGFPFSKSMWDPQKSFLEKKRRIITYDIRGYGKSGSAGTISIEVLANDLLSIMEKLKLDKVIACGLSMGGYILLNAVSRFPEKFKALIFADTQCIADSPEGVEKRKNSISQINENGLADFADSFVGNVFSEKSLINKIEAIDHIKNTILSTSENTITGTLNALAYRIETCSKLEKLNMPVLILCGEDDKVTPLAQSEFLNKNIPGSKFFVIEKAGHLSNLEQPDLFNKYISDFLED